MGQRADFEVFGLDRFGILGCLIDQRLKQSHHLGFGGCVQIQLLKFC